VNTTKNWENSVVCRIVELIQIAFVFSGVEASLIKYYSRWEKAVVKTSKYTP